MILLLPLVVWWWSAVHADVRCQPLPLDAHDREVCVAREVR